MEIFPSALYLHSKTEKNSVQLTIDRGQFKRQLTIDSVQLKSGIKRDLLLVRRFVIGCKHFSAIYKLAV